jgi:hypothetical protein
MHSRPNVHWHTPQVTGGPLIDVPANYRQVWNSVNARQAKEHGAEIQSSALYIKHKTGKAEPFWIGSHASLDYHGTSSLAHEVFDTMWPYPPPLH